MLDEAKLEFEGLADLVCKTLRAELIAQVGSQSRLREASFLDSSPLEVRR